MSSPTAPLPSLCAALAALVAGALGAPAAHAACEAQLGAASKVTGLDVAPAYQALIQCNAKVAEDHFGDFMRGASDVEALVNLSLAAIDKGLYTPVRGVPEKIADIGARDEVARAIGASCADHPNVVPFLQGIYKDLSDRQFGVWRDAYRGCQSPTMVTWLHTIAGEPPARPYDEKYGAVTEALVRIAGLDALPTLEGAAIKAGKSDGPFTTLMDRVQDAARPQSFGANLGPEEQKRLEGVLTRVATNVPPDKASIAADRLYQLGSESAAASLLPSVYPDRVQPDGSLLYGVAAVEACDNEVQVHVAAVTEPAKRWSVHDDVAAKARSLFKPRLKCDAGEWPVVTSAQPLANREAVAPWAREVVAPQWEGKGEVKLKEEKDIALD